MNAPAAVVQRQLDAYNARDVDALLATYAADARQFEHPDKRLATGHAEMRTASSPAPRSSITSSSPARFPKAPAH